MGTDFEPHREDVRKVWSLVIAESLTREEAHGWSARWVEGDGPDVADMMVRRGLQYIHGYDLRSESGAYAVGVPEIKNDLERWIGDCESYDRDPGEWVRVHLEIARRFASGESRRNAQPPGPATS